MASFLVALQITLDSEEALTTLAAVGIVPTVYALHVLLPMW